MEWKTFSIDKCVYSQDAILMTGVELADKFTLQLSENGSGYELKLRTNDMAPLTEEDENFFLQYLAHNEIRVRLKKAFVPLENAIVQKAFNWNK